MPVDWNINPIIFKVNLARYVLIDILLFSACFCNDFFVPSFFALFPYDLMCYV